MLPLLLGLGPGFTGASLYLGLFRPRLRNAASCHFLIREEFPPPLGEKGRSTRKCVSSCYGFLAG